MASPSSIVLSAVQKPIFSTDEMNPDAASKASELLQENHQKHHIFFNKRRFHVRSKDSSVLTFAFQISQNQFYEPDKKQNHIVHHLLTIYALGASPGALQEAYSINDSYQRLALPVEPKVVSQLSDPEIFKAYLGKEENYGEFLRFFQSEMEEHGWQRVINTYLFANTSRSNDLFGRLFAGLLHPLIHLGFGLEFEQPAIIAEALSQAAVHENWVSPILWKCEEAARRHVGPRKPLLQILDEIREDKAMHEAVRWEDDNKLQDGLMVRAPDHAVNIVGQWSVKDGELESKTLEMLSSVRMFSEASLLVFSQH
jgi:hypothetical protein